MSERLTGPARPVVIGVAVAVASLLVSVLAVLLQQAPATAGTTAGTTKRRTPVVSISRSATTVLQGDKLRLSGQVKGGRAGSPVLLQRTSATTKGWVSVRRGRLGGAGRYAFDVRPVVGALGYRAYLPASTVTTRALSRRVAVNVLGCDPGSAPSSRLETRFTSPHASGAALLSRRLGQIFCAASPGARIDVAMYFIRVSRSADVQAILRPLERVARYRRVRVRLLLEGRLYPRDSTLARSLPLLRRFATVVLCQQGCHNERLETGPTGHSTMHHKFVTVSDTRWRSGIDPVVVSSSGNWSTSQLHMWQSASIVYGDPVLTRDFSTQFETMLACASPGRCASWASRLVRLGLSPTTYGMTVADGLWADRHPVVHQGSPGRGTSVFFSPRRTGDFLVSALQSYTCTPAHHTVRVAHMFITPARRGVLDALVALRSRGCTVSMVWETPGNGDYSAGVALSRGLGFTPRCIDGLHDKVVSVDAVDQRTGVPDRSVWTGSQSLGNYALRRNDEAQLRLRTTGTTGTATKEVGASIAAYQRHLSQIEAASRTCPS
jgi:hypothetical protein